MTPQFTVGEIVRHRDTARTATIRSYDSETDTYEIQFHDHHTWRDGVRSSELDQPIYSATATHKSIMGTLIGAPAAGISVPIGQCIELINAAVAWRTAARNLNDARTHRTTRNVEEYVAIVDAVDSARTHLHRTINALPEQEN